EGHKSARIQAGRHGDAGEGCISQTKLVAQTLRNTRSESSTATEDSIEHLQRVIIRVGSTDPEMAEINIELLRWHCNELYSLGIWADGGGINGEDQKLGSPISNWFFDFWK